MTKAADAWFFEALCQEVGETSGGHKGGKSLPGREMAVQSPVVGKLLAQYSGTEVLKESAQSWSTAGQTRLQGRSREPCQRLSHPKILRKH